MKKISHYLSFALIALIFLVEPSFSAESKVGAETQYVFNKNTKVLLENSLREVPGLMF